MNKIHPRELLNSVNTNYLPSNMSHLSNTSYLTNDTPSDNMKHIDISDFVLDSMEVLIDYNGFDYGIPYESEPQPQCVEIRNHEPLNQFLDTPWEYTPPVELTTPYNWYYDTMRWKTLYFS